MKYLALALLTGAIFLAGCTAYPYHHYESNGGYYYYGPNTFNPTYYGPYWAWDP